MIHLLSLIEKSLYRLYILYVSLGRKRVLEKKDLYLQGIDPFHLSYQICRYRFVHYIPVLLTTSMGGVVIAPLSFLILVISLFFSLLAWPGVYPFYQSFQRIGFWVC